MQEVRQLLKQIKLDNNKFSFLEEPESIEILNGDAGVRVYYRLSFSKKKSFPGLDYNSSTILLCYWPLANNKNHLSKKELKSFLSYIDLTKSLMSNQLCVPKILGEAGEHFYFLEDLGNQELESVRENNYNYLSLEELNKFHSLKKLSNKLPCYTKRWRYKELLFLLKQINKITSSENYKYYCSYNSIELSLFYSNHKNKVKDYFKEIVNMSFGNQDEFVPNHRDFHCRNILIFKKKLYFIDYQDAFMAPAEYDLASFLWDPYREINNQEREKLLKHYYREEKLNQEKLTLLYFNALQRLYKAMGTYYFQINSMSKTRYLSSLTNAVSSIKELELKLKKNNSLSNNSITLVDILFELNDYLQKKNES